MYKKLTYLLNAIQFLCEIKAKSQFHKKSSYREFSSKNIVLCEKNSSKLLYFSKEIFLFNVDKICKPMYNVYAQINTHKVAYFLPKGGYENGIF